MRKLGALSFALLASCSKKADEPVIVPPAIVYTPAQCGYSWAPSATRGYTDLVLDGATGGQPLRVRIGLGGKTTSGESGYADPTTTAVFTWETHDPSTAAKVRLGTSPNALTDVRTGHSWTTPPPGAGVGANEPGTSMHEVHVCGLTPATTYYYQVGGGSPETWGDAQQFATPPSSGKVIIGLSGDSRDSADVFQTLQTRMRDAAVNFQIFSGDLILFGTQQSLYGTFLDKAWKDPSGKLLTLGQQMMLMVAGNHEQEAAQFFGNFALPGEGTDAETYASFDIANAHIVLLDDESIASSPTSDASTEQLAWLETDLTKAEGNRAKAPFIVVVHHRGEFSTSKHKPDKDMKRMRDALVPVWDKHHVDLVLNGHDHNYERSKPITGPASAPVLQPSVAGTTYVVCAGSGAGSYQPGTEAAPYREKSVGFGQYSPPGTSYLGVYATVTLEPGRLTFNAFGLKAAPPDDVIDSFVLTR